MSAFGKICLVAASPATVSAFLAPHIIRLARDYRVTVVCNGLPQSHHTLPAQFRSFPIFRHISILADIRAFCGLYAFFGHEHFDLVHSYTPKAGLLAMTTARLVQVPVRMHTFTGQVWATRRGTSRALLSACDRLTAACATTMLADSSSQLQFLEQNRIVKPGRGRVLANGSVSGVDLNRFAVSADERARLRTELHVPADAVVFLFVGRINRDKGILDLAEAFAQVAAIRPGAYFMLVGPDEGNLTSEVRVKLGNFSNRLLLIPFTPNPEKYMQFADVICLPSYREGFGTVLIEAAACGLPCVASRIYGITDAVDEGVTGLLHSPKDVGELLSHLRLLYDRPGMRSEMGENARVRAIKLFAQPVITEALAQFYQEKILL